MGIQLRHKRLPLVWSISGVTPLKHGNCQTKTYIAKKTVMQLFHVYN